MTSRIVIDYLAHHPTLVPKIASWVFDHWGKMYKMKSVDEQIVKFSERLNIDSLPLAYIALDGNEPTGTASLKIQEMTTHPHLHYWLGTVYVSPRYRHRGIGRLLVRHAEAKAVELNIHTLYLHTPDKEHFYLHQGWETIERPEYFDMQVAVMKKELISACPPIAGLF